jgi:hypothetical protein
MEGMLCDSADDCTDFIVTFRSFNTGDNGLPLVFLLLHLKETCSSILNIYHDPSKQTCQVNCMLTSQHGTWHAGGLTYTPWSPVLLDCWHYCQAPCLLLHSVFCCPKPQNCHERHGHNCQDTVFKQQD